MRKERNRGTLPFPMKQYGKSALGTPLLYAPCKEKCTLLAIAGIHGEEPETTFLLSRILRHFEEPLRNIAFVLCANPDGAALGTRGNSNGVDLNRNFPATDWSAKTVLNKATLESRRITELSPGKASGSEAETKHLVKLIRKLKPVEILSIHSPLACVESPAVTSLTRFLTEISETPYKKDIGYPTPGSLGTWCGENSVHCVTWELPRLAPEILVQKFARKVAVYCQKMNGNRNQNMSLIRSKDTSIEVIFRKALWKAGFRYRKNYKKLPGKPDIALTKQRIAIFCDGEFWHGKNWDEYQGKIKSNRSYWLPKIDKNIKRDFETDRDLRLMGWEVLRFWGGDIEKNLQSCIEQVKEAVFYREIGVEP